MTLATAATALPLPGAAPSSALAREPVARRLAAGWVARRAQSLLEHAASHSAFYRAHHARWRPSDGWQALPPVRKAELMANFDEWVTDPRLRLAGVRDFIADPSRIGDDYLGRYAVWTSSGTTGHPGVFVHDGQALATYATLMAMRGEGSRVASSLWGAMCSGGGGGVLLAATGGHYAGISFWERQRRLQPWLAGQAHTLSVARPLPELLEALNAIAPSFVSSYPSMLAELAEAKLDGRLRIQPAALWSGGEGLAAPSRERIRAAFGAPVANDYGSSEMLTLAHECAHQRLHVNDDWVILEPVDAAGHAVPAGVASHSVLITNLANRVQPIIRYDLGDSITWHADRCACGDARPSISVQGRRDDVLRLLDSQGRTVRLSPMAVATAVEHAVGLARFQVRQTDPRSVTLRLALAECAHPAADKAAGLAALRGLLAQHGLTAARVSFDAHPPAPERGSGKLRLVVCALGPAPGAAIRG